MLLAVMNANLAIAWIKIIIILLLFCWNELHEHALDNHDNMVSIIGKCYKWYIRSGSSPPWNHVQNQWSIGVDKHYVQFHWLWHNL